MGPAAHFLKFMNHGGFVMWPLLLLSIISVTATVERTLFWIRLHGRRGVREYDAVVTRLRNADEDGVRAMDRAGDNLYADVAGGCSMRAPTTRMRSRSSRTSARGSSASAC